jgi:hypothetical protein
MKKESIFLSIIIILTIASIITLNINVLIPNLGPPGRTDTFSNIAPSNQQPGQCIDCEPPGDGTPLEYNCLCMYDEESGDPSDPDRYLNLCNAWLLQQESVYNCDENEEKMTFPFNPFETILNREQGETPWCSLPNIPSSWHDNNIRIGYFGKGIEAGHKAFIEPVLNYQNSIVISECTDNSNLNGEYTFESLPQIILDGNQLLLFQDMECDLALFDPDDIDDCRAPSCTLRFSCIPDQGQ